MGYLFIFVQTASNSLEEDIDIPQPNRNRCIGLVLFIRSCGLAQQLKNEEVTTTMYHVPTGAYRYVRMRSFTINIFKYV